MFRHRLALFLGYASVKQLMTKISAKELDDWRQFMALEPMGWPATNLHQALIRSVWVGEKGKKIEDFLLNLKLPNEAEGKAPSPAPGYEEVTPAQAIFRALGDRGTVIAQDERQKIEKSMENWQGLEAWNAPS